VKVKTANPEWGEPGIAPQSIIAMLYEMIAGKPPKSAMIGRGFWYRDVLAQLRSAIADLPQVSYRDS